MSRRTPCAFTISQLGALRTQLRGERIMNGCSSAASVLRTGAPGAAFRQDDLVRTNEQTLYKTASSRGTAARAGQLICQLWLIYSGGPIGPSLQFIAGGPCRLCIRRLRTTSTASLPEIETGGLEYTGMSFPVARAHRRVVEPPPNPAPSPSGVLFLRLSLTSNTGLRAVTQLRTQYLHPEVSRGGLAGLCDHQFALSLARSLRLQSRRRTLRLEPRRRSNLALNQDAREEGSGEAHILPPVQPRTRWLPLRAIAACHWITRAVRNHKRVEGPSASGRALRLNGIHRFACLLVGDPSPWSVQLGAEPSPAKPRSSANSRHIESQAYRWPVENQPANAHLRPDLRLGPSPRTMCETYNGGAHPRAASSFLRKRRRGGGRAIYHDCTPARVVGSLRALGAIVPPFALIACG
ncbi:hypothetical protein C8R44DRAFT_866733 [Mycena epipterygia]|nr:hypothetical protein C8R44DRAFT_866733 [Mycena epipterygia]